MAKAQKPSKAAKKATDSPSSPKPKNKSSPTIILIIVAIVALSCCVLSCAIALFFVLLSGSDSAERSFEKVVENDIFAKVSSFQYEQKMKATVGIAFPSKPEHDYSYTEERSAKGEYDVEQGDSHEVQDSTMRTEEKTQNEYSEVWYVNKIEYERDKKGGTISKLGTREESLSQGHVFDVQDIEVYKTLSGKESFEVIGEETVEGIDCYHIKLKLERKNVKVWMDWFRAFVNDHFEGTVLDDDIELGDMTFDLWIKKGGDRLVKSEMHINSLSFATIEKSTEYELYYHDLVSTTLYKNWGEPVHISAPI